MARLVLRSSLLLVLTASASSALASEDLAGDYIHVYYGDAGICYDNTEKAGIQVTYGTTPYEWTYASSTIQPLLGSSVLYTKGTKTYEYEGHYSDTGYSIDWTTTGEEDLSAGTVNESRYTWEMGDLEVVKTETWEDDGMAIFVKFDVTNIGTSKLKSFTYAHVIDPVDSASATRSSNTRNDLMDLDGDSVAEFALAQGRKTTTSTNNKSMAFGLCDPRTQTVGFSAGTEVTVSSISLEADPDGATSNYQLIYEDAETSIEAGETQMFGFVIAFGTSSATAQEAFTLAQPSCYDLDGDGYENDLGDDSDCDDEDASVNPSVSETWYDGVDQDCGRDDDYDQDGDGYVPDEYAGLTTADPGTGDTISGTGTAPDGDCDDTNKRVNPGVSETWYDGIDENCDEASDYDQDEDGYVPDEYAGLTTTDPGTGEVVDDGTSTETGDCDDTDSDINPGADETWYDGIDENCDGGSDYDADGDGYVPEEYADLPTTDPGTGEVVDDGSGTLSGDCNDADSEWNPDADEIWYDGIDENCDGADDYDQDGDGYVEDGNEGLPTRDANGDIIDGTGELPSGDCDDTDALTNPEADEIWYDGIDENCDGADDYDQDGDGYVPDEYEGLPTTDTQGNEIPGTGELPSDDCDDTDGDVHPGADDEWYDGIDSDCAGNDDYDQDGDGTPADGYDTNGDGTIDGRDGGDCDDKDSEVGPGADDEWYDGIDSDCEGNDDYDQDGDGSVPEEYEGLPTNDPNGDPVDGTGELPSGDCDDTDGEIHAGASETWYDGIDEDCGGDDDYDADGDGHVPEEYDGLPTYTGPGQNESIPGTGELPPDDCDDSDPTVIECAAEVPFYKGGGGCTCSTEGEAGTPRFAGLLGLLAVFGAVWQRRRQ